MTYRILTINPGSTSTKIALFEDENCVFKSSLKHSTEDLSKFDRVSDQLNFRKDVIMNELKNAGIDLKGIACVVGRGGLLKPLISGVYEVNDAMRHDLNNSPVGEHASKLGGLMADDIAKDFGVKAYIADPVVVDELEPVARLS